MINMSTTKDEGVDDDIDDAICTCTVTALSPFGG
jgi:hypothetical protein